ncbi:DUF1266 domain-containing protein [Gordonia sp. ABSL1-1]|uniref:protein kinase domain-containing protein n=1 Tax=Gordonia sp. ABSL1-1 TaxID=3053923 RepID=UPI002572A47E|nr:DUF1266 domain-containing protein [Gordonia sp. ABSL1-1]MDL9936957.1 DUF1266 domain-containing protein [Gordonia sp. ABSL1-1]
MSPSLAVGDEFAGYRIVRRIGVGGMGEVYLAGHPRLPRQDALKILAPTLQDDGQYRERFSREADVASTLMHPNIVPLHDRGEYRDRLWISMAYIDGSDAAVLAAENPDRVLPVGLLVDIVAAIADALDHAHDNGLLHRDVKPGNILLTRGRRPRIYLADFGIAKPQDGASSLTSTGAFIGSLAYCAPEQALAEGDLTAAADQYQLACTAFDMLTGTTPFAGANLVAVLHQHLSAPPPRPRDRRPDLPAALDDVFGRALAKDPAARYPSCGEFAEAFVAALASNPAPVVAAAPIADTVISVPVPPDPSSAEWEVHTQIRADGTQGAGYAVPAYLGPGSIPWSGVGHRIGRMRGLGAGAYFAITATDDPVDDLWITASDRRLRKQLRATWAISDRESAVEVIDLLTVGLDAPDYDPCLAAIHRICPGVDGRSRSWIAGEIERIRAVAEANPATLGVCVEVVAGAITFPDRVPRSVAAWDLSRLVILLRYCAFVGFMDVGEVWERIEIAGRLASAAYSDWVEYAVGFEVGRALFVADGAKRPVASADASFAETRSGVGRLLTDPSSPWLCVPLR